MLLAKVATLGAAVLAMAWFSLRDGFAVEPVLVGVFLVVTLLAGALLGVSLRGAGGESLSRPPSAPGRG